MYDRQKMWRKFIYWLDQTLDFIGIIICIFASEDSSFVFLKLFICLSRLTLEFCDLFLSLITYLPKLKNVDEQLVCPRATAMDERS